MVDVGQKDTTRRRAMARGVVQMSPSAFKHMTHGAAAKGDVLSAARIAGIMAAKKTHELIPFCHPLGLSGCTIDIDMDKEAQIITITCRAKVEHKTGVEMEALTGASIAALAVYDMLKAVSHDMVIEETRLIEKTGGKSDVTSLA